MKSTLKTLLTLILVGGLSATSWAQVPDDLVPCHAGAEAEDNEPVHLERRLCDADGNFRVYEVDENDDGVFDRRTILSYDEHGRISQSDNDEGADDTIDGSTTFANEYDEAGNLLSVTIDYGADGVAEMSCVYEAPCPAPFDCSEECHDL